MCVCRREEEGRQLGRGGHLCRSISSGGCTTACITSTMTGKELQLLLEVPRGMCRDPHIYHRTHHCHGHRSQGKGKSRAFHITECLASLSPTHPTSSWTHPAGAGLELSSLAGFLKLVALTKHLRKPCQGAAAV